MGTEKTKQKNYNINNQIFIVRPWHPKRY